MQYQIQYSLTDPAFSFILSLQLCKVQSFITHSLESFWKIKQNIKFKGRENKAPEILWKGQCFLSYPPRSNHEPQWALNSGGHCKTKLNSRTLCTFQVLVQHCCHQCYLYDNYSCNRWLLKGNWVSQKCSLLVVSNILERKDPLVLLILFADLQFNNLMCLGLRARSWAFDAPPPDLSPADILTKLWVNYSHMVQTTYKFKRESTASHEEGFWPHTCDSDSFLSS